MVKDAAGSGAGGSSSLRGSVVLVTGGTGLTGRAVIKQLLAAGAHVRGIFRDSSRIAPEQRGAVTWVRGDVYDERVVAEATEGVRYVLHLAACFRDGGAAPEEYHRVHVRSTQLLARAALRQTSFKRFVHVSTVGVHGHIERPPADENTRFAPGDVYQETKLEGELWIRDFAQGAGLPLAVVRPTPIMGAGDRRLLKLFRLAKQRFFPLLDGRNTLYHLIHVEDLAACILLCAHHPAAEGQIFICGNSEATDFVSMLTQIGGIFGVKVRFVPLPSAPILLAAEANDRVATRLGVRPWLYPRRVAFFTKDRAFDTRKVRQLLSFIPRTNEQCIADTAQAYMHAGWL